MPKRLMSAAIVFYFVGVFSIFTLAQNQATRNESEKIQVSVYYEALCIDSMTFFRRHLTRSLIDNNRLQYVNLTLIPFGKADIYVNPFTNVTEIICQHGFRECELNALHACIIEENGINANTLLLLNCMMNGYNNDIEFCSKHYGFDVLNAKECVRNRTVIDILAPYGTQTSKLSLTFVPSITLHDNFDSHQQFNLRNRFDSELCKNYKEKFGYAIEGCSK